MDKQTEYFECNCGCEVIKINVWQEKDWPTEITFCILKRRGSKTSWGWRFHTMWRVLTKGYPYEDDLLLEVADIKRLRNVLNDVIGSTTKTFKRPKQEVIND